MLRTASFVLAAVLVAVQAATSTFAQEVDGLRVLLVAHDPAVPKNPYPDLADERTEALYRELVGGSPGCCRPFRDRVAEAE